MKACAPVYQRFDRFSSLAYTLPCIVRFERRYFKETLTGMLKDKILVVDDEQMIRWTLSESLRGWGYTPVEAETVAAALAAFEADQPAAVLLDINLPDGSGL